MAPYNQVCRGNGAAAVALYHWNARISASLWEVIGHVEVVVRNAMHTRLTTWSTSVHNEPWWYLDPGQVFNHRGAEDIADARRRATKNGQTETPGRVVAELNFGFWRYLTARTYHRTLWTSCLCSSFPGQSRATVQAALEDLHLIRNRCAHHEPIHNRNIPHIHATALEVAGWVSPDARRWVAGRSTVVRNLAGRP
jgi:hypothetical protein